MLKLVMCNALLVKHLFAYKQIEFYFGDSNLQKDRFMKQEINKHPEGCEYFVLSLN